MTFNAKTPPPADDEMDELLLRLHPRLLARTRAATSTSRTRRSRIIIGCAALVLASGGAAVAASGVYTSDGTSSAEQSNHLGLPHGTLPDGRTYGAPPVPEGHVVGDGMPDLVPATGDHGKEGLVDAEDLLSWEPEKACASIKIPLYALDGTTQIDTLTIGHDTELVDGLRLVERSGPSCTATSS